MLVVEPLGVSSSHPLFRAGLNVLKQRSSEVAGAGDGPRVVEVNPQGSSGAPPVVRCAHTSSFSHLCMCRSAGGQS